MRKLLMASLFCLILTLAAGLPAVADNGTLPTTDLILKLDPATDNATPPMTEQDEEAELESELLDPADDAKTEMCGGVCSSFHASSASQCTAQACYSRGCGYPTWDAASCTCKCGFCF